MRLIKLKEQKQALTNHYESLMLCCIAIKAATNNSTKIAKSLNFFDYLDIL